MPKSETPWGEEPPPNRSSFRLAIWLAVMLAVGLAVWGLSERFPGRGWSGMNEGYLVQLLGVLAIVSASVIFRRRINFGEATRHASIWLGIAAVLVLGYAFQSEFRDVGVRIRSELIPGYAIAIDPHVLVLTAGEGGQFYAIGEVNGTPVTFLVDTGASDIVLSPTDAQRVGIDTGQLRFTRDYETANGLGRGAPYTVANLSIGTIALTDVPVSINEAGMSNSLLGMPFFKRLDSFEIKGRRLYLRSRS